MKLWISRLAAKALVDRKFYAERYPDVALSGMDLVEHFRKYGLELPIRSPNRTFEKLLSKFISAIVFILACRGQDRSDFQSLYVVQARSAYLSGDKIAAAYYYYMTLVLVYLLSSEASVSEGGRTPTAEAGSRQSAREVYQQWLQDFSNNDPGREVRYQIRLNKLWQGAALISGFLPITLGLREPRVLRLLISKIREAYLKKQSFKYMVHARAIKRVLKLNFSRGVEIKRNGLQFARHIRLDGIGGNNAEGKWSFAFDEKTPVGPAKIFGIERAREIKLLKSRPIIIPLLRNVTIFAQSNVVLLADGGVINDTGAASEYDQYISHSSDPVIVGKDRSQFLLNSEDFKHSSMDRGVMLCGVASNAYGHWFSDYLARLEFCEKCESFSSLPIIVDEDMPQSHFDLLRMMVDNQVVVLPKRRSLSVNTLLYAPPLTFFPVHLFPNKIPANEINPVNPQSYRYIKRKVEQKIPPIGRAHRKIFLSRRNSSWRRLINDEEISIYLSSLGYEIIQAENYNIEEQIKIFQSASHIVAANGSSLQNIIFCDRSVNLLILAQPDLNNWGAYNAQVGALGYEMGFLCGARIDDVVGKHNDYVIPLPLLKSAMVHFDR